MYCYLPVFLCIFESFRRDLHEAKAVYIADYLSRLPLVERHNYLSGGVSNVNRLRFMQIPSKRLKKTQKHR